MPPDLLFHVPLAHFTEHIQSVLIIGFPCSQKAYCSLQYFGATLAREIRTLIEYTIIAHATPGWTRTQSINTVNRFIV